MCGIVGVLARTRGARVEARAVQRMRDIQAHRGPDDAGMAIATRAKTGVAVHSYVEAPTAIEGDAFAALAHRRLSIIDLSPAGHQPMSDATGALWITFNGEIYNFETIRAELEAQGTSFRSRTDTEVIVEGYREWGPAIVERLEGMFAFAILDLREPESPVVFAARDRVGVKPFYYAEHAGLFAFASEAKALLELPGFPRQLDLGAVDQYLAFLFVPEPRTMLVGVHKLPPAHWMRVTVDDITIERYWRFSLDASDMRPDAEIAADLRQQLGEACTRQMVGDVPVGAFLSGGLDSTAIVALLAKNGKPLAQLMTVGFSEADQRYEGFPDDLRYARLVADQLEIPQHVSVLTPDIATLLPKLIWHLDEPLADPAVLPLYQMCLAARPTKVLLSGMGGDELFGGYRRHANWRAAARAAALPRGARKFLRASTSRLPSAGRGRLAPTFRRIKRFARAMDDPSGSAYVGLAAWTTPEERRALLMPKVMAHASPDSAFAERHLAIKRDTGPRDLLDEMLYGDLLVYLPSHNLNYTDRISMAASVEVRVPLLDEKLLSMAARLPGSAKVAGGQDKRILRQAMSGVVPEEVLKRGKAGLGAPIRAWLVGPLAPLVEETLAVDQIAARGLFRPEAVARAVEQLRSGREDTSYLLWALLVLELWMRAHRVEVPA